MSKSGLYAHFGSKEELQLATVETAVEMFETEVVTPTAAIEDPLARVDALSDRFLDYLARRVFPGGCFFAAAAAEFDPHPGPVKQRILEVHGGGVRLLEDLIAQAQTHGAIKASDSPSQLAFEIDAQMLMANMVFVLYNDESALERARRGITTRIDLAKTEEAALA
jgi:AcrR family transcriptional regulator